MLDLTPGERMRIGEKLGEEALRFFMSTNGITREEAIRRNRSAAARRAHTVTVHGRTVNIDLIQRIVSRLRSYAQGRFPRSAESTMLRIARPRISFC